MIADKLDFGIVSEEPLFAGYVDLTTNSKKINLGQEVESSNQLKIPTSEIAGENSYCIS